MKLDAALLAKFGHTIQIAGAIYVGEGRVLLAPFPEDLKEIDVAAAVSDCFEVLDLDLSDWEQLFDQTDKLLVEILAHVDGQLAKVVVRKCERNVEQVISWAVYRRDNYRCRYCAADDVPLTVDHLVTWEDGGPSIVANLVACCRKCNCTRGTTPFFAWLESPAFLARAFRLSDAERTALWELVPTLRTIPRRRHVRSR